MVVRFSNDTQSVQKVWLQNLSRTGNSLIITSHQELLAINSETCPPSANSTPAGDNNSSRGTRRYPIQDHHATSLQIYQYRITSMLSGGGMIKST